MRDPKRPLTAAPGIAPSSALALTLVLAAAVRLWLLKQGLPDFSDEAIPFKQALEMWGWETGRVDLNPHFFGYPTFAIYLHFLVQKIYCAAGMAMGQFANAADYSVSIDIDPTGPVVAARLLGIGADLVSVWMAWRIAESLRKGSGFVAAGIVALSPTLILTSRAIHVDTIAAAFAVAAAERLLAWQRSGGRSRLCLAVVFIGLAAGSKYPGGLMVIPLAWSLWSRARWRGLRLWPVAALACVGVFAVSSPWALFDFSTFARDFAAEMHHLKDGHLGVLNRFGSAHYARLLLADPGPVALVLCLLQLVRVRSFRDEQRATITLLAAIVPILGALFIVRMEADRYLVLALPLIAPLAAIGLADASARFPARIVRPALMAALLVPIATGGCRAAFSGRDSTQQLARRWCEEHLGGGELLVQEAYGVKLATAFKQEALLRQRYFQAASPAMRARIEQRKLYRVVSIPMATSGNIGVHVAGRGGAVSPVVVFPHAADINRIFYDARLYRGVDYLLVSGAMRRRYQLEPDRFAPQLEFYRRLDESAGVAARFTPGTGTAGPEIIIYELGPSFSEGSRADMPEPPPLWWTSAVPAAYISQVSELVAAAPLGAQDHVAPWIWTLRPVFSEFVMPFALEMGMHLANRGRLDEARAYASTVLQIVPESDLAAQLYSYCAIRNGDLAGARRQVEATLGEQRRLGLEGTSLEEELSRVNALILKNGGQVGERR